MSSSTNDVEKRWHDPAALRAAVGYVIAVIVVAVAVFTYYAVTDQHDLLWAVATPATLFVGALGAFAKTYGDWRRGRTWPIWHGAGWSLLTLTMVAMAVPAMGITG